MDLINAVMGSEITHKILFVIALVGMAIGVREAITERAGFFWAVVLGIVGFIAAPMFALFALVIGLLILWLFS